MKLRSHLTLLVLGTLLPILLFTAFLILIHHQETRRATEGDLEDTARALSMTLDREFGASIGALQVLAASDLLRTGHIREFERVARGVLATQTPRWDNLVLYDPMGRELINLRVPFGTRLPPTTDVELIDRVVRPRMPGILNLVRDRQSKKLLVRVAVPILIEGTPRYVLGASLEPASLAGLVSHAPLPAGSLAAVLDPSFTIVARSRAAEQFVGQRATPDFIARASQISEGAFRARTKEGNTVYAAVSRSPLSGWMVSIGVPEAVVDGPLRTSLWLLTGAGMLVVLVGTTWAVLLGRRLERPIQALAAAAPRLVQGETIVLPRSRVLEMNAVAEAVETSSRELARGHKAAAAMARIGQAFTDAPDVVAVGQQIVDNVLPVFDAASASLRLVSPDGSLRTVALRGTTSSPDPIVDAVAPGLGISGAAITEGIPVQSSNILEDPRIEVPDAVRRWMVESGLVVWLSVPLRVIGKTIGALSIGDRAGRAFSPSEVTLLQTFADQAALALQQAQLFEESEHRRRTAEALAEIGRLLSQTLDPRLVGTRIVDSVRTLLAAQSAVLYSLDPSGVLTAHTVSMDTGLVFDWTLRLEPGVGIAWLALDQRGSVMTSDAIADSRLVYRPDIKTRVTQSAYRALLAVPLNLQDRMLGVLVVADRTGRVYQERDAQLAQAFAAQAAIALENASLYQDLQRAYDDLSHAQVQLAQAQKMEAIGQLAGGVAHDFNNLLTVISGRSALLLDQLPADDPVRRSVEPIQKSAERAATLTRQLLAFSRRQVLQPTVLDLNHLVTGLLPMLQSLLGESVELVSLPEANPGSVTVDPGQLEQVIVNLIVNARDAMPRGGELTIRTDTVSLDVESAAQQSDLHPGPYVLLMVTDTGHGMSPEVQAKVFDPFFTTKGVGKGTGLGLSMAYGIVSQHKGTIVVESKEGQGSTFTIYLPQAVISEALSSAPGETDVGTSHGTETILLVDDQEDLRSIARDVLAAAGYTVLDAPDGPAALRIAQETPGAIELLLTDVVMPQMSGRELVEALIRLRPATKVLYMSGHTDDTILHHGVSEHSVALLLKPFRPALLLQTVRAVLDGGT